MSIDDFATDPEAETCSTYAFSGVEGVKNPTFHVRGHACAGISDGKHQATLTSFVVHGFATPQKKPSSRRHRIDRVPNQIVQDLSDLTVEAVHGVFCPLPHLHDDVIVHDATLKHGQTVADKVMAECRRLLG